MTGSKPIIDLSEASVCGGQCDDISAAADVPTLDELLAKILATTFDLLADNHLAPVYLQIW
jgi:hypothetical protein